MRTIEHRDHDLDIYEASPEQVVFRVRPKAGYPVSEAFFVQVDLMSSGHGHWCGGRVVVLDDPDRRIEEALIPDDRDMDIFEMAVVAVAGAT